MNLAADWAHDVFSEHFVRRCDAAKGRRKIVKIYFSQTYIFSKQTVGFGIKILKKKLRQGVVFPPQICQRGKQNKHNETEGTAGTRF